VKEAENPYRKSQVGLEGYRTVRHNEASQDIAVHYLGPAVEEGRIDLFVLSDGLRGLGRLTNRVSHLMFGSRFNHRIELDSRFDHGSIVIPLHIASEVMKAAEDALASKGAQALSTLMSILGWGAIPGGLTLYSLFKKKQGRPITEKDDLKQLLERLEDIEALLMVKIYNDLEVQAALRATLRPLRAEGIEEFQTRRRDTVIESVSKRQLAAADDAQTSVIEERDEKTLDIEKAALVPHLAWHFSDGGKPFDAKIYDTRLWDRIVKGEKFGLGDRMRVVLKTSFFRDSAGRLTVEREIPEVLDVEHATVGQRGLLWPDEEWERPESGIGQA
jgi:hypothetical protein